MILTLNAGSSSLKYALFDHKQLLIEEGKLEEIGTRISSFEAAVDEILKKIPRPHLIGHRIVHGGSTYSKPTRITDEVIRNLEALIPFSPLHLPTELTIVKKLHREKWFQVACFDTAFHHPMPLLHKRFPLPSFLLEEGIIRYGFHGLSYEYIMDYVGKDAKERRIIIAHLGNGSSMAAVLDGKPFDTTMGFTPAGGLMMGTRCGDLDPGVLCYLVREKHYTAKKLDHLINAESGLLGVSEKTSEMQQLLESRKKNPKAEEAIALFCYIARKTIGSLTAALGGLDLLIFTGGIGENAHPIREEICQGLQYLNIDKKMRVVPTNENLMIARHCRQFL